ncbi:MAG TPA: methionyl-tRNA formyltransferase [Patescibacteria group bacterium]|nr:methionyl-tRNA formyltransferase [Patescibacteria group bacterium]
MKICFLGSEAHYSQLVKKALIDAKYELTDNPDQADLLVVAAHGAKISPELLTATKFGGLNIHPSLLPKYRGATPVPHTILNGDTLSGVTIIKMNNVIDAGPIVAQRQAPVNHDDTAADLLLRLFSLGAESLIEILPDYLAGKITLKPQPEASPTPYCHRFTKQDGFIAWKEFKGGVDDKRIRAFYPWPGIWTKLPNGKILKLLPAGRVQLEGKQPISWQQFLAGYKHLM